jgi:hypothetical protein
MVMLTASVDVQLRVTGVVPEVEVMVLGEAVKVTDTGETVTVAVAVVVPPGPVAVAVKVVVWVTAGVVTLPAAGVGTAPIPLLMLKDVALEVDHVSVEVPLLATVVGNAENWTVGATWFTVMVAVAVAVPPGPVAVRV